MFNATVTARVDAAGADATPGFRAGDREAAPGLRFIGFAPVPGQIRYLGVEAKRAARLIARQMRHSRAPRPDGARPAVT